MQEIKRFLCAAVAVFFLMLPVTVDAQTNNIYIFDDADILTYDEELKLQEYLGTLDDDMNYLVATSDTSDYGSDTDSKLRYYYTSVYSSSDDGIAFMVDMDNREIYISGYGKAKQLIKNDDALDITDNVYRYASRGDYYDCIQKAYSQADVIVNKGFILRPMRIIVSLLLAILVGFLFTFIWAVFERSSKNIPDETAQILMAGATIAATAAIYDTRKTRRSSDSGSNFSSGGGGFSGGGGGFSGGSDHSGGGHSF